MTHVSTSTSVMRSGMKRLAPNRLWEFAAWLLRLKADQWRRRAQFYERHRDYFPRLSAGRFVDRCRELEATYQGIAEVMFGRLVQDQWVPVRGVVLRRKHGRRTALPDRPASISSW